MVSTVKEQWISYLNEAMPRAAGVTQLKETRRAFYAGAWAMFCLITAGDVDELPPDQWAEHLKGLAKECADFGFAFLIPLAFLLGVLPTKSTVGIAGRAIL